jgi:hypothetical protein
MALRASDLFQKMTWNCTSISWPLLWQKFYFWIWSFWQRTLQKEKISLL